MRTFPQHLVLIPLLIFSMLSVGFAPPVACCADSVSSSSSSNNCCQLSPEATSGERTAEETPNNSCCHQTSDDLDSSNNCCCQTDETTPGESNHLHCQIEAHSCECACSCQSTDSPFIPVSNERTELSPQLLSFGLVQETVPRVPAPVDVARLNADIPVIASLPVLHCVWLK